MYNENLQSIGNPDMMDVFEEYDFRSSKRKNSDKYKEAINEYKLQENIIPHVNDILTAKIIKTTPEYLVFDSGIYKDYIYVDNKPNEALHLVDANIGDEFDIMITHVNNTNYMIEGSIDIIFRAKACEEIEESQLNNDIVTVKVLEYTPIGYKVEIQGYESISAIMPNTLSGVNKLYDPEALIGQELQVYVENYLEKNNIWVVNRKRFLMSMFDDELKKLHYNTVYTGNVTGTTDFGVFVEFNNCLTGMIHKSNIIPEWRDKFEEIKPGFKIDFYIKEIIGKKIILTQILTKSVWDIVEVGQEYEGTVELINSGILVKLDDETKGMINFTEDDKRQTTLKDGDTVKVRIESFDRMTRKIFLTLI